MSFSYVSLQVLSGDKLLVNNTIEVGDETGCDNLPTLNMMETLTQNKVIILIIFSLQTQIYMLQPFSDMVGLYDRLTHRVVELSYMAKDNEVLLTPVNRRALKGKRSPHTAQK